MSAEKARIAAVAAALTAVMTALATLTAAYGVVAGLVALVFAVAAIGVGAPTVALMQTRRRPKRPGRPKQRSTA